MLRLILAIITGFIIITVLSTGTDFALQAAGIASSAMFSTTLLLVATAYRFIYQIGGSYVACFVAKDRAKACAWTLGIVGSVAWLAGAIAMKDNGSLWYGITGAVLSIPSALIGWKLFQRRV